MLVELAQRRDNVLKLIVMEGEEEGLERGSRSQSRLTWTIKLEDIAVSYVEQTYLPGDPQGRTITQDRNGIQFTFDLTTSNMTSPLLESTMNVIADHTLLNGTIVECEGTGSVTPNTVIHMRGIKTCLLYTSPSPRDATLSRMPSSA